MVLDLFFLMNVSPLLLAVAVALDFFLSGLSAGLVVVTEVIEHFFLMALSIDGREACGMEGPWENSGVSVMKGGKDRGIVFGMVEPWKNSCVSWMIGSKDG